jgi:hypothetical protein
MQAPILCGPGSGKMALTKIVIFLIATLGDYWEYRYILPEFRELRKRANNNIFLFARGFL